MRVSLAAVLLLALPVTLGAQTEPRDPLARARLFYNQQQFDSAIVTAEEARADRPDAADLIGARAFLERYRISAAPEDLASARTRLRRINPVRFTMRERTEFIIGLGETLYFDNVPGAAADLFASVLDGLQEFDSGGRERVLDWWATAMDTQARPQADLGRRLYQEIRDRMRKELAMNPGSATAAYWVVAATRGGGDLDAAWEEAMAAWLRAPLTADAGANLRGDLDRLVQRAIVPERAKARNQPPDQVMAEWEQFKEKWAK